MKKLIIKFSALLLLFAWIHYSLYIKPSIKTDPIHSLQNTAQSDYQVEVTHQDGTKEYLDLDEYLIGVVAGEMPLTFEDEALKAQTIASRTYVLSHDLKVDTTTNTQVYLTIEQMKKNWQNEFEQKYERLKEIVYSTHNIVMEYNHQYISALFFSSSNGKTANSEDYFASGSVPYLRSVDSQWELSICPNIERTFSFTQSQINNTFNKEVKEINILSYYDSSRVKEVSVDGEIYTGRQIRELLNLASTDFSIEQTEGQYVFKTIGYGHGVGMSQYGANGMALNGYNYEDILKYYYQGVEICKL